MKTLFIISLLTLTMVTIAQTTSQNPPKFIQIKLKSNYTLSPNGSNGLNTSNATLNQIFNRYNVTKFKRKLPNSNRQLFSKLHLIHGNGNIDSLKSRLDSLGIFEYVEVFEMAKTTCYSPVNANDPLLSWNQGGWIDADALDAMDAKCAWSITTGNPDLKVAVVDSDIDISQPDLDNKIPYYEQQGVDNFNNKPSFIVGSHGTRSLGVISAQTNNNIGVASIGYNTKTSFFTADNVSYTTSGTFGDPGPGILRAFDLNNKIISISWSGTGLTTEEAQDIVDNGTLLVVAAGNDAYTHHNQLWSIPGVIIVSAVDESNNHGPTGYSHYSGVDLCAMFKVPTTEENNDYVAYWGTSSCAPQVAGTAALMLSVNPCLTPPEIEEIIKSTTDPIADASSYPGTIGTGRLNAYKAVLKAAGKATLTVNNGYTVTISQPDYYKNITVKSGGTLNINNTTLYINDSGQIVVEAGGKLFITNSTVRAKATDFCTPVYRWGGIYVEGK